MHRVRMILHRLIHLCVTLGPVGYLPAPGTWGSLVGLPIWYALRYYGGWLDERFLLLALAGGAWWLVNAVIDTYTEPDPSEIVIDEVVGIAVAFYTIPIASDWRLTAVMFVLFRVFDIGKPLHIAQAEAIPGAFGIILDDIIAGVFASITLHAVWSLL